MPRRDESVDWLAQPGRPLHVWRGGPADRSQRPVIRGGRSKLRFVGPFGPLIDPSANQSNFLRRQGLSFFLRRHAAKIFIDAGNHAHQPALGALSSNDLRPAIATIQRPLFLIQPQAALLMLLPVARET